MDDNAGANDQLKAVYAGLREAANMLETGHMCALREPEQNRTYALGGVIQAAQARLFAMIETGARASASVPDADTRLRSLLISLGELQSQVEYSMAGAAPSQHTLAYLLRELTRLRLAHYQLIQQADATPTAAQP
jgi:hypothetical protein